MGECATIEYLFDDIHAARLRENITALDSYIAEGEDQLLESFVPTRAHYETRASVVLMVALIIQIPPIMGGRPYSFIRSIT